MDFAIEAAELTRALSIVKGVVPSRSTLPILQHFLIEASAGRISVRGTCIDMEASTSAPADVKADGAAAIHADMLFGLAKRLPKSAIIVVSVADNIATVAAGKANYKIKTLPVDTFPIASPPEGATLTLPAADLRTLFTSTASATDPSSAFSYYRGIYLHPLPDPLRLVAVGLDGHRMAYREIGVSDDWKDIGGLTIPTGAAQQIVSMIEDEAGDVEMIFGRSRMLVRCAGSEISTAVIECEFPDYSRFLPKPNGAFAAVKPEDLIDAVERAIVVLDGEGAKVPAVGLAPGAEGLSIVTGKKGHEVASETLQSDIREETADVDINANYLTQMLKLWPDGAPVEIQQAAPGHPVLIWSKDLPAYRQVIMPFRR